eukprot:scaffold24698_cov63-Phaeocystis_antarctica.AAC.13
MATWVVSTSILIPGTAANIFAFAAATASPPVTSTSQSRSVASAAKRPLSLLTSWLFHTQPALRQRVALVVDFAAREACRASTASAALSSPKASPEATSSESSAPTARPIARARPRGPARVAILRTAPPRFNVHPPGACKSQLEPGSEYVTWLYPQPVRSAT